MDERLRKLLAHGREHYEKKEFDKAEPFLKDVAHELPDFADVQNMLGVIFFHQERYESARQYFEKALRINPKYTEAALNLAVTYNELGRYDDSMEIHAGTLAEALGGDEGVDSFALGKIANMHAELAAAYEDIGMLKKAAFQYQEALALCPEFADIRTRLGNVLREMGELDSAEKEYREAKSNRPSYVPARVYLGVTLFSQGKKKEAVEEWEDALNLDPDNRLAVTSLRMVKKLDPEENSDEEDKQNPEE